MASVTPLGRLGLPADAAGVVGPDARRLTGEPFFQSGLADPDHAEVAAVVVVT